MNSPDLLFGLAGIWIAVLGLRGVLICNGDFQRILAANILGSGVFLTLVTLAGRAPEGPPDPVPQGMILTGIVVAVSSTALLLALLGRCRELEAPGEEPEE